MKTPKIIRIGTGGYGDVFCRIELKDKDGFIALSITGVEGPKSNGDAKGSCGQIQGYLEIKDFAPGWNQALLDQFIQTWEDWHLNDMRAGCEHQRANWDVSEKIEVVKYKQTREAYQMRKTAQKKASLAAVGGVVCELTATERALLASEWFKDISEPPDADDPLSGCYEVSKREEKFAGWVYPHEHPRGLMCKPCEVCGYKYGSAWLKEPLPDDVIQFLESLPETDKKPAWV